MFVSLRSSSFFKNMCHSDLVVERFIWQTELLSLRRDLSLKFKQQKLIHSQESKRHRQKCFNWKQEKTYFRVSVLKDATLSYFIISKNYFINYIISFYNISYIQKLYYFTFSLKYYFFNFSLLFLLHHHFFSAEGGIKYIYIYFQHSATQNCTIALLQKILQ